MKQNFRLVLKALCLLLIFAAPSFAALETKLKDNGGHHFKFEGKNYVITMDVNGQIFFTSKKLEDKDTKVAKEQRVRLIYRSSFKEKNNFKHFHFNKMKTSVKAKSSSFTLVLIGEMENGVKVSAKLQGDKSKVILMTEMTCPDKYKFNMWFGVPEAPEEYKSRGLVVKLTDKKKKLSHVCSKPYETKYYKDQCRQVMVQNRNALSLIFDAGKAEGYLRVAQHSHHAGSILNNPFTVSYNSPSQNWDAKKNTFIFSF